MIRVPEDPWMEIRKLLSLELKLIWKILCLFDYFQKRNADARNKIDLQKPDL